MYFDRLLDKIPLKDIKLRMVSQKPDDTSSVYWAVGSQSGPRFFDRHEDTAQSRGSFLNLL